MTESRVGAVFSIVSPGFFAYTMRHIDATDDYERVWTVPFAGGTPVAITSSTTSVGHGAASSPNCTKVAFGDSSGGLSVCDADGSNVIQIDAGSPQSYTWSPDGTMLAFTRNASGGMFSVNSDGTNKTAIGTLGFKRYPVWNFDGTLIAYTVDNNNPTVDSLRVVAPDGTFDTVVKANIGNAGRGGIGNAWSRTTNVIYYAMSDFKIWKINSVGSGDTQISTGSGKGFWAYNSVSPDNTELYFTSLEAATNFYLSRCPVNGSGQSTFSPNRVLDGSVQRGVPMVAGGRIYSTLDQLPNSLFSVLPDGSDYRIEHAGTWSNPVFETFYLRPD